VSAVSRRSLAAAADHRRSVDSQWRTRRNHWHGCGLFWKCWPPIRSWWRTADIATGPCGDGLPAPRPVSWSVRGPSRPPQPSLSGTAPRPTGQPRQTAWSSTVPWPTVRPATARPAPADRPGSGPRSPHTSDSLPVVAVASRTRPSSPTSVVAAPVSATVTATCRFRTRHHHRLLHSCRTHERLITRKSKWLPAMPQSLSNNYVGKENLNYIYIYIKEKQSRNTFYISRKTIVLNKLKHCYVIELLILCFRSSTRIYYINNDYQYLCCATVIWVGDKPHTLSSVGTEVILYNKQVNSDCIKLNTTNMMTNQVFIVIMIYTIYTIHKFKLWTNI